MAETRAPAAPRATRQLLSERQSATVDALLDAGLAGLREQGYEALSLRDVAARAGVTHTTAYTYFTSKDHLVAELAWCLLEASPAPTHRPGAPLADRIAEALRAPSEVLTGEPALAEGVLNAMIARDPESRRLREAIGADLARRVTVAVGPEADRRVVDGALLLYNGAMLEAGLRYSSFDEVIERIRQVVTAWEGRRIVPAL